MNLKGNTVLRRVLTGCSLGVILIIIFFSFRGILLRKGLDSVSRKLKGHHYQVHWEGASFKGLKSIFIEKIYIQNEFNANEIDIDSMRVSVQVFPLILKRIKLKRFECGKISVTYLPVKPDTTLRQPEPVDSSDLFATLHNTELDGFANRKIRQFFGYVPAETFIHSLETRVTFAGRTTMTGFSNLKIERGKIAGKIEMESGGKSAEIIIDGLFSRSLYKAELRLVNTGDSLLPLAVIKDKYGIVVGFDTMNISLDMSDRGRRLVNLSGIFSISGFELGGERISTESIRIKHFSSDFLLHVGQHYVELDSSSQAWLNRIRMNPYFNIRFEKKPVIRLKLLPVIWDAGDFFSSLPPGMFTSVTGLKAEGRLHYFLDIAVDMANIDSLRFNTSLTSEKFKIISYGADDFRKINGSFYHEVYERGIRKAAFIVGSDNPEFVPFENISQFVRAAVLTSEDGSFFYHSGFNPDAFRESMVTNIHEKRFARGGSTISMQLVKNVFLTRNKTFSRKIEEALIVWLIEHQHLVSKQRMYEVYLNLIEWGPGVYGINQAGQFYFNKRPADLTLQESIYLASIVPNPKLYRYTFEANGVPKAFFGNYFQRMKELMVKKQFIAASDTFAVRSNVLLTGPASLAVASAPSMREEINLQQLDIIPALVE